MIFIPLFIICNETPSTQSAVDDYLASSGMPGLTSITQQESPITLEELQAAVGSAKMGKTPGPDGFTV